MSVATPPAAPARACAYRVIRRVFEHGAYTDRALAAEAQAAGLDQRDRALAMQLTFGAVQRRATLDHVAQRLSRRPVARLDAAVLAAVRLGMFQLLFLDAVAEHAVVNESVELARAGGSHGTAFVNAVLRRAAREGRQLLSELDDRTPEGAAVLHSVPGWLAAQWWQELGADGARALLRRVNQPAEAALRVNTLLTTPQEVLAQLPVPALPAPEVPEGLVLDGPFDLRASPLHQQGQVMAQSRGSMLVSRSLDPRPGERVLDLCAAPGGKTTHIAALMENAGQLVAVERNPGRARALMETCFRMRAEIVRVETADAAQWHDETGFDRVLVDPPCSGLGTLQSRPDIRWRASPENVTALAALQARILAAGAAAARPGGVLVYSVCTISKAEGDELIDGFLSANEAFTAEEIVQTLPHRDGTDGFFIAKLCRSGK